MPSHAELIDLLNDLRAQPVETEWLEFKEAKRDYPFDKLGQYFSALSNEANLQGLPCGWMVLGVAAGPSHSVVGTRYRATPGELQSLKHEISRNLDPTLSFEHIHEVEHPDGRVLMLQIPPAPRGIPVAWNGHWYGREGESLGALSVSELERIRAQAGAQDWSAVVVPAASVADLDGQALLLARAKFKEKYPELAQEVDAWDNTRLLLKLRLMRGDGLTRAALILLGTPEISALLSPAVAQITWLLKGPAGEDLDYEHFRAPLIRSSEDVFGKIRNLTSRYLPAGTLFPTEIPQYDSWVIREALHNCIVHQDYTLGGRVNLVEKSDELIFSNLGDFLPGSVEHVIESDVPPERYRNQCLADAMFDLKMIDTRGGGIRRMFQEQRGRFFPLPDYTIDPRERRVEVRIPGRLIDEKYTQTLIARPELSLSEVILLDKVQKQKRLSAEEIRALRSNRLIEGRAPNVFISAQVADMTGQRSHYIRSRGLDKSFYKELVIESIRKFGPASRKQINELLLGKLPEVLTAKQKQNKISNLLGEMSRKDGTIRNEGSDSTPRWALIKRSDQA